MSGQRPLAGIHLQPGALASAGQTTLQQAYDNDPTDAQILLDNVPNPVAVRAQVAGDVFLVQDLASNNVLQVTADPDLVEVDGQLTIRDVFLNSGLSNSLVMADTVTLSTPFIGGGILSNGTVTYANPTWIWALLQESKGYIANTGAGFAAFTLFNAIPFIRNGTSNALVQALILNAGVAHQATGANAVTTIQTTGLSFSPNTRALSAGGSMTKTTGDTAVRCSPTFGTVGGSSISFGTIRGLHLLNPAVSLFQPSAGIESMTAYIGVEMNAIPFGGNVTKRTIRSALAAATNALMIENTGGAASDFGAGGVHFNDSTPVQFGGVGFNNQDASVFWDGAAGALDFFFAANSDTLAISNPVNAQLLINAGANELTFNTERGISFGDQLGTLGNQYFNFVQGDFAPTAGEATGVLLTQSGSFTNGGFTRSRVSAWVINGMSYASSSGTVTESDTLTVGGMVTSSPGVTITDRQSLHVIAGRSRFDSAMQYEPINPAALASGDTDDWAGLLTGTANNNMRHWARITGNADQTSTITGIDAGSAQDGDTFELTNVDVNTITLSHEDTGSAAANRFAIPGNLNYVLTEGESVRVRYDSTTSRWRVMHQQQTANFGLTGEWQFDDTTTMADPGDGNFRNNNATVGSVTAIAIADETKPGTDAGNILAAVGNGDRLYIQNKEDANEFLVFDVTSNTDNTGWHQIGGTVLQSGGNFTDGKEFIVTVVFG